MKLAKLKESQKHTRKPQELCKLYPRDKGHFIFTFIHQYYMVDIINNLNINKLK